MPNLHEDRTSTAPHTNGGLEEVQKLLLAAERERLDQLEDHLRNSVVDATAERGRLDKLEGDLNQLDDHIKNKVTDAPAVANVLPNAICQRTKQDQQLEKSLVPIIGKVFVRAVKGSPQLIADAISPVMMPAIRKAIETAVQGMVQSMNRTLDHSGLSWRGMTWRWEALTTGRPFREVLLSHTFGYQVERVFLFFREDGIHLADVHIANVPAFEPGHEDLITSMFSKIKMAVQKFARDEFQASEHASMNEFKTDDGKTVLIEQGPKAVLAAVVRGLPSPLLRPKLQDALDTIHLELNQALQNFRGDKQPFEAARPHLESCLLQEEGTSSHETGSGSGGLSPVILVLLILVVSWVIWWNVTSYAERQRWAEFLDKASKIPGIHITATTANGKNGKAIVYGLRDPLSDDPRKNAREAGLADGGIDFQFEPYLSLAPQLIERRAREVLHVPDSVRLSVSNDTRVLSLAGTAPHAWIAQFRKASPTIPGVTSIQDAELEDADRKHLDQLVRKIEECQFDFEAGSASFSAESGLALQELLRMLRAGDALAQQLGSRVEVEIQGNTSEEGAAETNRRLALARAQGILSALNVERFLAIDLLAIAGSAEPSVLGGSQDLKPQRVRRVSFRVTVNDSQSIRSGHDAVRE